jgi:hypothetical protein
VSSCPGACGRLWNLLLGFASPSGESLQGGQLITFVGDNFGPVSTGAVYLMSTDGRNVSCPVVSWSHTRIVVEVPPWQGANVTVGLFAANQVCG